jgi:hypothetical protein
MQCGRPKLNSSSLTELSLEPGVEGDVAWIVVNLSADRAFGMLACHHILPSLSTSSVNMGIELLVLHMN